MIKMIEKGSRAGALLRAGCFALAAAMAAPAVAEEHVVARVGDIEITDRELGYAEADLGEQFQAVPEAQRKAAVLNALIDIKLIAAAAAREGLGDSEEFKSRIAFLRERALHNSYFQEKVLDAVTDEEVRARYDKEIAALEPQEEIRARHILLKSREEAEAVIDKLEAGADFVELAKTESAGPSGPTGGDLGFFGKGQMVPEFENAAFALADGEFTRDPVQTQFGWHVILREEHRTQPPPEFDAVKDQVRQIVMGEKYRALLADMREGAQIEIVDETLRETITGKNAGEEDEEGGESAD